MKFLLFITIALSVFALLNLYIWKRFIQKIHLKKSYKNIFLFFLVINFIAILLYMYSRYNPIFPNFLFFLFSLSIGVIFVFFVVTIFYDISHFILEKSKIDENRRLFFKKSLDISAIFVGLGLVSKSIYNATFVEIEKVSVKIENLKKSYTIVQLSDIHIGGLIDEKSVDEIVKKSNIFQPDIVVITGDLVDIKLQFALPILEKLKNLTTQYGTYFVVGNHEYIHGVAEIIEVVEKLGIKVLENESVYIGESGYGFNLSGVYDVMGYRMDTFKPDIKKALQNRELDSPTILLAHQPKFMKEVKEEDGVDLVLSGHTHGGQIYPFHLLVGLDQPYVAGLYQHNLKTQIYVNKGTGFWGPPMRLGTSCEITVLELRG